MNAICSSLLVVSVFLMPWIACADAAKDSIAPLASGWETYENEHIDPACTSEEYYALLGEFDTADECLQAGEDSYPKLNYIVWRGDVDNRCHSCDISDRSVYEFYSLQGATSFVYEEETKTQTQTITQTITKTATETKTETQTQTESETETQTKTETGTETGTETSTEDSTFETTNGDTDFTPETTTAPVTVEGWQTFTDTRIDPGCSLQEYYRFLGQFSTADECLQAGQDLYPYANYIVWRGDRFNLCHACDFSDREGDFTAYANEPGATCFVYQSSNNKLKKLNSVLSGSENNVNNNNWDLKTIGVIIVFSGLVLFLLYKIAVKCIAGEKNNCNFMLEKDYQYDSLA